jgi:serine/threonine protein phosphatase 1
VYLGKATAPEGLRLYAIGDVHGCDDLLADVHERVAADLEHSPPPDHRIIHVGDYVDRGPDSAGVVERLARQSARDSQVVCLRGNHEQMLLDFLADPKGAGPIWLDNGGAETLASYGVADSVFGVFRRRLSAAARDLGAAMPEYHCAFLENLLPYARFGDFVFVHAGIRPGVPLEAQEPGDLGWIRDEFLFDGRDHGYVVVHGHTITDTPEVLPNRINIDTGAVFSGVLTCLVIEGSECRFL